MVAEALQLAVAADADLAAGCHHVGDLLADPLEDVLRLVEPARARAAW